MVADVIVQTVAAASGLSLFLGGVFIGFSLRRRAPAPASNDTQGVTASELSILRQQFDDLTAIHRETVHEQARLRERCESAEREVLQLRSAEEAWEREHGQDPGGEPARVVGAASLDREMMQRKDEELSGMAAALREKSNELEIVQAELRVSLERLEVSERVMEGVRARSNALSQQLRAIQSGNGAQVPGQDPT